MDKKRAVVLAKQRSRMEYCSTGIKQFSALVADTDTGVKTVGIKEILYLISKMMDIDHNIVETLTLKRLNDTLQHRYATDRHKRLGMVQSPGFKAGAQTRGKNESLHKLYVSVIPCSRCISSMTAEGYLRARYSAIACAQ